MNKKMNCRYILISALFLLALACAKISTPSGGPKDVTPPVVVTSEPVNGAINFKGDQVDIEFDEYVVLDNINEKFMVSPPMKAKPRVFIKGKHVEIELNEKLKDSTTYTFYFLDAIKDLNEGNILQNYQFVFSTGPVIDSLSVTGNLYDAFNLEVPEKTNVIMYHDLADSSVKKHIPDYISKVDPTGYFRIDNIRPGTYKLYGLKDADNSKNYNLPDEEFAFLDSAIFVTPEKNFIPPPPVIKDTVVTKKTINKKQAAGRDTTNAKGAKKKSAEPVALLGRYKLFQFLAQKKNHYLASSHRDLKYEMLFVLSLPPDSMKVDFSIPGSSGEEYFTESGKNRDSLKIWIIDSALYSQPQINTVLRYPFTDTLGVTGYKQDTILMRFLSPRVSRSAKIKKSIYTFESNILSGSLKPGQSIVFNSKTPFRVPDTSRIKLYEIVQSMVQNKQPDTSRVKAREMLQTTQQKVTYRLAADSSNSCRYHMYAKLVPGKKYLFVADSASFSNIYNEYSDSVGVGFIVRDPGLYGTLSLEIKNYSGDRIIQLLDKTEKLIAEKSMKTDGKLVFPLLESGFYRLRVIYDINGDGKWTTGDFTVHRQPEPVSYYLQELEMKANWEIDQTWDIGVKNFKNPKMREIKKTR